MPHVIDPTCLTGNCTFPGLQETGESYQTLGFDSACVDISSMLKFYSDSAPWSREWSAPDFGPNLAAIRNNTMATTIVDYKYDAFAQFWTARQNTTYLLRFVGSIVQVDWACIIASELNYKVHKVGKCYTRFAAEYRLWPSVQSVSSRIGSGRLHEKNHILYSPHMKTRVITTAAHSLNHDM
jgi:hypothetical protein